MFKGFDIKLQTTVNKAQSGDRKCLKLYKVNTGKKYGNLRGGEI